MSSCYTLTMYYEQPGGISYRTFLYMLRIIALLGLAFLIGGLIVQHYQIEPWLEWIDVTVGMTLIFGPVLIGSIAFLLFQDYLGGIKRWRHRQELLRKFASKNGFDFVSYTSGDSTHKGMPFNSGQNFVATEVMQIVKGEAVAEIGTIVYSVRETIGQAEKIGYIAVELDREVPQILLDAQENNKFGSNLLRAAKGHQTVALEGDFNKYFTAYAPHDYEVDLRYILTPDMMALLIDEAKGFDVEFVGNHVYIYRSGGFDLLDEAQYDLCMRLIGTIGDKADTRTRRYRLGSTSIDSMRTQLSRQRRAVIFQVVFYAPLPFIAAFITYFILS